jgi:hypothetical protein
MWVCSWRSLDQVDQGQLQSYDARCVKITYDDLAVFQSTDQGERVRAKWPVLEVHQSWRIAGGSPSPKSDNTANDKPVAAPDRRTGGSAADLV